MKLVYEIDPHDFSFWSGAANRMEQATEEQRHEIFDRIEELSELAFESGQPLTDTDINYYVWFKCDDVFDEEVED